MLKPQTNAALRSTFLLEVALDQERLKQRIAERLRDYRQSLGPGYPQEKVAPLFGVGFSTYQRWERAVSMPRWTHLERMAEVMRIDIAELVGDGPDANQVVAEVSTLDEIHAILDALDRRLRRIERRLEKLPPAEPQRKQAAKAGRRGGSG